VAEVLEDPVDLRVRPMIGGIFPSRARRFRLTAKVRRFAGKFVPLPELLDLLLRVRSCAANRESATAGSTP